VTKFYRGRQKPVVGLPTYWDAAVVTVGGFPRGDSGIVTVGAIN